MVTTRVLAFRGKLPGRCTHVFAPVCSSGFRTLCRERAVELVRTLGRTSGTQATRRTADRDPGSSDLYIPEWKINGSCCGRWTSATTSPSTIR